MRIPHNRVLPLPSPEEEGDSLGKKEMTFLVLNPRRRGEIEMALKLGGELRIAYENGFLTVTIHRKHRSLEG